MSLRPLKFITQVVLLEEDHGVIVGERQSEPVVHYSAEALEKWLAQFTEELAEMNRGEETE
jgi:hypothetical protein